MIVGPTFDRDLGRRIRVVLFDIEVDRDVADASSSCELNVDEMRLIAVGLPKFG